MLTVEDARNRVIQQARRLPPAPCPLSESRDCLLAEDVVADLDQPPFDKSLVDGFAVRSADLATGNRRLRLGETILAGQNPTRPLGPLEAATIMTGAPLPSQADAVVMHERTKSADDVVLIELDTVQAGQNVLLRGQICRAGDAVLAAETRLTPPRLGLLASVGKARVAIVPRPSVAVIPTGDELVELDQIPAPGQIRNSNAIMLEAMARQQGALPRVFPIARDEPAELEQSLRAGLDFDVLTISGGVSAGQRDLVPAALERLGVRRIFHKVRVKPGKPLWFGVGPERGERPGTLVFGLPGNPVSSLVGFLLFVQPCLQILAGLEARRPESCEGALAATYVHRGDRPTYHPARLARKEADPTAMALIETLDWAGSADLLGLACAEGFALFPPGDRVFEAGEIVRFLRLG
jgi:molybdopterin molybdotransferase